MLGIMNKITGKISPYYSTINFFSEHVNKNGLYCLTPKDYINTWGCGYKCQEDGCFDEGYVECHLTYYDPDTGKNPEDVEYHYCSEHAFKNGFCRCCGGFWGPAENFEFGNGVCLNCRGELEDDDDNYNSYVDDNGES